MSVSIRDLKREESCVLATLSVSGSVTCLLEYRNGHELHLAPYFLEGVDKGGVLGGLLALPLVATEVSAEDDLAEEEVAFLPVEGGRVRLGAVRDSSGVDEVGGCSMSRAEEAVLYFEGKDPFGDE